MDINSLYLLAKNGDVDAESELFRFLSVRFRHFADHRIWNDADAEEVTQEALMTISKEYKELEIKASFEAWAYKVLDNRILKYIQSKKRQKERMERMVKNNAGEMVAGNPDLDLKRKLIDCLRKLGDVNARYARILNLHYQGYDSDEICTRMDISISNLYTTLSRARSLLEYCLQTGKIK